MLHDLAAILKDILCIFSFLPFLFPIGSRFGIDVSFNTIGSSLQGPFSGAQGWHPQGESARQMSLELKAGCRNAKCVLYKIVHFLHSPVTLDYGILSTTHVNTTLHLRVLESWLQECYGRQFARDREE